MSDININLNLNAIPEWFALVVEKFQELRGVEFLYLILAIIFPPLAAFLKVGISTQFWINLILTMLGGLPGQIHALWLVLFW